MTKQEFKEIRLALGLSQQQLASKLGILKGQISKIERGAAGITEQKEEVMKMLLREHRLNRIRVHMNRFRMLIISLQVL